MNDERFAKGERVYLPIGDGVVAPTGHVWEDDGSDYVVVVHMAPVFGAGIVRNHIDEMAGRLRVPRSRLRIDRRGRTQPTYTEVSVAGEDTSTIVAARVEHLGALVKDATRPEEVRRRLQMSDFDATRDIFAAAGRLLREVEDGSALEEAAAELRGAFDRWIPGWDQPESGLDLN